MLAVRATLGKELPALLITGDVGAAQAQAAETEDYQEGRAAFLEKRKPRFIGR